ncbi:MAG: hypothetical protein ACMZ66_06840 [Thalassospira sp.]|uniref:hypothetical protein n=1 Tax=Thalassospira sp. TaxID=1912094 RepID=UPI000AFE62C3
MTIKWASHGNSLSISQKLSFSEPAASDRCSDYVNAPMVINGGGAFLLAFGIVEYFGTFVFQIVEGRLTRLACAG